MRFGDANGVPNTTVNRWVKGKIAKPRSWRDIVKLAAVLRLTQTEADQLLQAAGHKPLATLMQTAVSPQDHALFDSWRTPHPSTTTPPFQAPPRLTHFVGRQSILKQIARQNRTTTVRRWTLQGMGGVGKSSIAIELAYTLKAQFPDGVLWLRLAHTDPMTGLQLIASAYGQDVSSYIDSPSRSSKVRELLANKTALLILDDAQSDAEIRPYLPPTGQCAVIITSRRHDLAVAHEGHIIHVPPFDIATQEGMQLFEKILGRSLDSRTDAAREQILELLGHHPLAVHIAATRIRYQPRWTAHDFLRRLQKQENLLNLLQQGDKAVTLLLDVSFEQLREDELALMETLGLFGSGDFDVTAVSAITQQDPDDSEDALHRLFQVSLLQLGRNERYQLHPLVAAYCQKRPSSPTARDQFILYFIEYARIHATQFDAIEQESTNIDTALRLAHHHQQFDPFLHGVRAHFGYLQTRGLLDRAKEWLVQAEAVARKQQDVAALTAVLHQLGLITLKQGDPDRAEALYQEGLGLAEKSNNDKQLLTLLLASGSLAHYRGKYQQAKELYEAGMTLAAAQNGTYHTAAMQTNLGLIAATTGDVKTAVSLYHAALELASSLPDKALTINILQMIGNLHSARGNFALAIEQYEAALAHAETTNNQELTARLLGNLGKASLALDNYTAAKQQFRRGLQLAEQSGLRLEIYRQRANLGEVATHQHRYEAANFHYREALAMARTLNYPQDIAIILNEWGFSLLEQYQFEKAEPLFDEAFAIAEKANIQREIGYSLFGQAQIAFKRGNVMASRERAARSLTLFEHIGHSKTKEVRSWLMELPSANADS